MADLKVFDYETVKFTELDDWAYENLSYAEYESFYKNTKKIVNNKTTKNKDKVTHDKRLAYDWMIANVNDKVTFTNPPSAKGGQSIDQKMLNRLEAKRLKEMSK